MADRAGEWWQTAEPRTGACRWCGEPFTTRARQRRYCGGTYREAARRSRSKTWASRTPEATRRYRAKASPAARLHDNRLRLRRRRADRPWITRDAAGRRVCVGGSRTCVRLTDDLWTWVLATCARRGCTRAQLIRAAITYDQTGRVVFITPLRLRDRGVARQDNHPITIHLSARLRLYLAGKTRRRGHQARAVRRMVWALRAAIDPPVSA